MSRVCFVSLLAALVFSITVLRVVQADSIKLDSGKVLEGTITSDSSQSVQINMGGALLTFPRGKVVAVNRTTPPERSTGTTSLERLQALEAKGAWPDLYEAATGILTRDTSSTEAVKKRDLAAEKIRESLGSKKVVELARQRKFEEAITYLTDQYYQSGLSLRPAGAVAKRALAELYVDGADFRMHQSLDGHGPLADCRKARELDPSTPGLDFAEGSAQMKLRDFDRAVPLLEKAARAEPNDLGVRFQLMQCYREKNDFEKIVRTFEDAPAEVKRDAERFPEVRAMLAEAYLLVASSLAEQKKTAAAAAYEKHLRFCERTANDLREAAAFFERIGDPERARKIRLERPAKRGAETRYTTRTMTITLPLQ